MHCIRFLHIGDGGLFLELGHVYIHVSTVDLKLHCKALIFAPWGEGRLTLPPLLPPLASGLAGGEPYRATCDITSGHFLLCAQGDRCAAFCCDKGKEEFSMYCTQGVTKRCRLCLLTNSALVIWVQIRGEGGSCGVSANEYSCAHHVTWSPNKLGRSTYIFNLWVYSFRFLFNADINFQNGRSNDIHWSILFAENKADGKEQKICGT
jgi:hypothetical protein